MRVFSTQLLLRSPWRLAHGTSTSRTNVFIDLEDGLGEAAIVPYYPYTEEAVTAWLRDTALAVADRSSVSPEELLRELPAGPPPAVCALDVALHDRHARGMNQPLHRLWNLSAAALPVTSITLSIPSDPAEFVEALGHISDWPLLKLKLGTGTETADRALVTLARAHFRGQLCVDANAAWDVPTATRMLGFLADQNVAFVEEPLHAPEPDDWAALRRARPAGAPPVLADESIRSESDIVRLSPHIDGINVKLAKTGGFVGAKRWIDLARERGLLVLIGCMVESSVGVTAAAHLAPLADFADLDGHLQIANDPFRGLMIDRGEISLPKLPGLGVLSR